MRLLRFIVRMFATDTKTKQKSLPRARDRAEISRATESQRPETAPPPAEVLSREIVGKCWVIDGDTIVIGQTNIRLAGIDAPELNHPFGKSAKWALHKLCNGQVIRAELTGDSSYQRVVATCYLPDGRDLSEEMVKAGHALDWSKHSGGKYRHLEAADARKRLWRCDARQKGRLKTQG
ncbi:thermonuclease family protein [Rhodobacter capsulatus]|uniref:thermonuclease family protein n=1 Tax=Rhodobacter capsulatus TaxID=1061 RepID=UPI001F529897|nr:thermonuclease family protein [Rhodobacter capsulatus]